MKVKLLKKVRKRYSINRIDKLASDCSDYYKLLDKHYELPFYKVHDTRDSMGCENIYCKTKSEALEILKAKIINDYREKFRHVERKETKVWFNR